MLIAYCLKNNYTKLEKENNYTQNYEQLTTKKTHSVNRTQFRKSIQFTKNLENNYTKL